MQLISSSSLLHHPAGEEETQCGDVAPINISHNQPASGWKIKNLFSQQVNIRHIFNKTKKMIFCYSQPAALETGRKSLDLRPAVKISESLMQDRRSEATEGLYAGEKSIILDGV